VVPSLAETEAPNGDDNNIVAGGDHRGTTAHSTNDVPSATDGTHPEWRVNFFV